MEQFEDYIKSAQLLLRKWLPKDEKELEWWIKFRQPEDILKKHATVLYFEVVFYITGFITLCHAIRSGGRFPWLWLATIAHGLTVESVSYYFPDIDNFWHAQSMIMLFGQRLPLHILFIYPSFIYVACVAVSHMHLRWWAEPFAVGLTTVLLDVPFDIIGVKLLWWTWHDDDPNIFDRHYSVPWTSYYFHAAFASSFTLLFFGLRSVISPGLKYQSLGFLGEIFVLTLTGLFSMPLGVLQFAPVYHSLHDLFGIHSEVCVLLFLTFYGLIVWSADRTPYESARLSGSRLFNVITLSVILHYTFCAYLVLCAKPQEIVSVGYHQPIGKCDAQVSVRTVFGKELRKSKYLCIDSYNEDYFDFKCLAKQPENNAKWYTICGTPYKNHSEYIIVVCAFCFLGLFWFWQLLARSGRQPQTRTIRVKHHKE